MQIKNREGRVIHESAQFKQYCELDLRDAVFEGLALEGAHFDDSNLQSANFREADLYWANFFLANLSEADFEGAQLCGADLKKANFNKREPEERKSEPRQCWWFHATAGREPYWCERQRDEFRGCGI